MISLSLKPGNFNKFICFLLLGTLFFNTISCKKKSPVKTFTYVGKWTVNYNFTTGSKAKGTFTATLQSNGKWDYVEGAFSKIDAGTWSSSGNTVNFVFNFSGLASYTGTKVTDNSLSGTAIADAGVSTGTWTATR